MNFDLIKTDTQTKARIGKITTDHGEILTPIFMPVGTVGSVKAVHFRELKEDIKAQIILGNTYHLYLRPGLDVLEKAGFCKNIENYKKEEDGTIRLFPHLHEGIALFGYSGKKSGRCSDLCRRTRYTIYRNTPRRRNIYNFSLSHA